MRFGQLSLCRDVRADRELPKAPKADQDPPYACWLDYRIENDPRFLRRIEEARKSLRAGRGVWIEDVE